MGIKKRQLVGSPISSHDLPKETDATQELASICIVDIDRRVAAIAGCLAVIREEPHEDSPHLVLLCTRDSIPAGGYELQHPKIAELLELLANLRSDVPVRWIDRSKL